MADLFWINKLGNYLKVKSGQLEYNAEKIPVRKVGDKTNVGIVTIVQDMARATKDENMQLTGENSEKEIQVIQWIYYAQSFVLPAASDRHVRNALLKELDAYFLHRSYLVGEELTLADLVVFYTMRRVMDCLTPVCKETYINLSRWFDHLQQNERIRQKDSSVNFATIYLHGWATGTHI